MATSPGAPTTSPFTFLVYGASGWIGGLVVDLLESQGYRVYQGHARLESREAVDAELFAVKPDRVVNCAGITGRPNIDWCEDHKAETVKVNVVGTLNLFDLCQKWDLHLTNVASGCIYTYDASHPLGSGVGFTELETPNFVGSFYSRTKALVEQMLPAYPGVLQLRLRMPISDDLHPRSFVTKITRYERVVNVPNSMSVIPDLLPILVDMSVRRRLGIYNFVNPGTLSHNQILDLYTQYIDPNFRYTNFTLEEQAQILKAGRSNCELDPAKLLAEYPELPSAAVSIRQVFERMVHSARAGSSCDLGAASAVDG